jgi:dihydroorotate dehydrogenase
MIFISPPFGNYLSFPNMIRVYGSFTLEPREGLWYQLLKTLRYFPKYKGWVNKIGLRNKGIEWALHNVPSNHIISIAIINENEIKSLIEKIPEERNIEINVSCPNVDKSGNMTKIDGFINEKRKWCIVKLSPNVSKEQIDEYYNQGFRQFHCSNTVAVPEGGLSGITVQSYSLKNIQYLRQKYPDVEIIGGGGIKSSYDIENYRRTGADHFSISSGWFHPMTYFRVRNTRK